MSETEHYSALMTTLSTIVAEIGKIQETVASIAPNATPSIQRVSLYATNQVFMSTGCAMSDLFRGSLVSGKVNSYK